MRLYPIGVFFFLIVAVMLLLFNFTSCKKDPPVTEADTELIIEFSMVAGGNGVGLGDVFSLPQGYKMRHQLFKFYLDNLIIEKSNGTKVRISDVILVDWRKQNEGKVKFVFQPEEGIYTRLIAGVGLDSLRNTTSPNSVPLDNPLSSSQGTHWDAWTLYRFIMLEGEIDTLYTTPQTFQVPVIVHTGFDYLYRQISLPLNNLQIKKGGKTTLHLQVDLDKLYRGTDFKKDNISHTMGNEALALLITDNFLDAFGVK